MDDLIQYWLTALCDSVLGVEQAYVVKTSQFNSELSVVADLHENSEDFAKIAKIVEVVLSKKKSVLQQNYSKKKEDGEPLDLVASPLFFDNELYGAVVISMSSRVVEKQRRVVQKVEGAAIWFGALARQSSSAEKNKLVTIVELMAACLEHDNFKLAATDVLTKLTSFLNFERISLGVNIRGTVQVEAVSHSGGFDKRTRSICYMADAMGEAIEQNQAITYPAEDKALYFTKSHEIYSKETNIGQIISVPFVIDGEIGGAIFAEKSSLEPSTPMVVDHLKSIAAIIGPSLSVRYHNEQRFWVRAYSGSTEFFGKIVGSGYLGLKLAALSLVAVFIALSIISVDYRVTGQARLEAKKQRVIVSPQDGYIAKAPVRPGDIVHSGDVLGTLDDKDLKLQGQKWASQLEQYRREYRGALAIHDRSKVTIMGARVRQAEAQLNLVKEQLARSRLVAPFEGIVVSGDLSQALGSPVERGQVLYTLAPLAAYRVILMIDERDIGWIEQAQKGELMLSSMPDMPLEFIVEKITPVATMKEGRNYFQVEAKIGENSDLLRPGMEGVAKIRTQPKKLIWIGFHRFIDWGRLAFWSILP